MHTDGVPLFVEELTKTVLESGVLREEDGVFALDAPLPSLAIPATLHDSLMARLDRLSPVKEIAQIGAAIGREFGYELIAAIAAMSPAKLDDALDQLSRAELIYARGKLPHATYTFKHALVQDAAYRALLRTPRQLIHDRIVAALETGFPEIVDTQPELLAHHCTEAGRPERAMTYLMRAIRGATERSAMPEAFALIKKGLGVIPHLPEGVSRDGQELELQLRLMSVVTWVIGYASPTAWGATSRALELAKRLDRPAQVVEAFIGQSLYRVVRAEFTDAISIADKMWNFGEERSEDDVRSLARSVRGGAQYSLGRFVEARADYEQALLLMGESKSLRERLVAFSGTDDSRSNCLYVLSRVMMCHGHLDRSQILRDRVLAESCDLWPHAYVIAASYVWPDDWAKQIAPENLLRSADDMISLCAEYGFHAIRNYFKIFRGLSLAELGRAGEGIPLMNEGVSVILPSGMVWFMPYSLVLLAHAHGKAGAPQLGLERLDECFDLMDRSQERWSEAQAHRVRGQPQLQTGDDEAATASFQRAIGIAHNQEARFWELLAATDLARLHHAHGKSDQAWELLHPIYEWFTEGLDSRPLIVAKALLEELARERCVNSPTLGSRLR